MPLPSDSFLPAVYSYRFLPLFSGSILCPRSRTRKGASNSWWHSSTKAHRQERSNAPGYVISLLDSGQLTFFAQSPASHFSVYYNTALYQKPCNTLIFSNVVFAPAVCTAHTQRLAWDIWNTFKASNWILFEESKSKPVNMA